MDFVKRAFLFYLGNVVFDSAASALEFWENNEKIKAQKAAFDAAPGEHRASPVSGADAVNAFINDKK